MASFRGSLDSSLRSRELSEPRNSLFDGRPSQAEIVRQQWSFSPHGSTSEVEDYQVDLDNVRALELELKPDLTPGKAVATLAKWRMV